MSCVFAMLLVKENCKRSRDSYTAEQKRIAPNKKGREGVSKSGSQQVVATQTMVVVFVIFVLVLPCGLDHCLFACTSLNLGSQMDRLVGSCHLEENNELISTPMYTNL